MNGYGVVPPRVLVDRDLCLVAVNSAVGRLCGVQAAALRGTRLDDWINIDQAMRGRLDKGLRGEAGPWREEIPMLSGGQGAGRVVIQVTPLHRNPGHLLLSLDRQHSFAIECHDSIGVIPSVA